MKKIKNFKIELRDGYILRELKKKKIEVQETEIANKINEIKNLIEPSTVYETFKADLLKDVVVSKGIVSVTIFAVTLGEKTGSIGQNEITDIILKDAMDVSKNFVFKLINLEAEKEHCELSEPAEIGPDKIISGNIAESLDISKIGIRIDSGVVTPAQTKFYTMSWTIKKKRK